MAAAPATRIDRCRVGDCELIRAAMSNSAALSTKLSGAANRSDAPIGTTERSEDAMSADDQAHAAMAATASAAAVVSINCRRGAKGVALCSRSRRTELIIVDDDRWVRYGMRSSAPIRSPEMKVLIDAVHPADVWTLGAVEDKLLADGADTLWLSRPGKDSVVELIEARGRPHFPASNAGTTMFGLAAELLRRDRNAWRAVRRFKPDIILTRSPAGVHAGRLTRTPVIYDTDDGHVAGFLFWVAGPFANLIASPTATERRYGKKHRRYRGYKELFYLHPDRFTPDPGVRDDLGLDESERLFVLRLTAFTASHDMSEAGMSREQINRVLAMMKPLGKVVISSESELPDDLAEMRITTPPERFHHVLAAADLVVGDSQTVCSEAGVVGTPSIRYNTWAGRHPYQVELEERWGLTRAFPLTDEDGFFTALEESLADLDGLQERQADGRRRMLEWCGDPVDDLMAWIAELTR